ncbi:MULTISPECIES: FUSC family protein [unclassified Streptomyces]|uniref:FUSC family protein n=1 Tax=Streptomyces sp. NBC_00119 TaxID=2975659 RepID=A0AAU1UGG5_9ACTN|nr:MULTISPECIES: FUSC family protein [unclassified Streptomyces]MCX4646138.1 FUSC family protein [Streptomyces sp. NBC_01446]MCX5318762.1 FUSC family protein [Streptomyces sp. NBC_00120]
MRTILHPLPPWLGHALRAQRGPVPWSAVVRGALAAGPLLVAALLAGRPSAGVLAALGAMFAGINDRPGSRRAAVPRIGVPALVGAGGLALGTWVGAHAGSVALVGVFALLGFAGGALSAVGPIASACGTQLLVAVAIGAGMPLPEAGWQRALLFLAGAGWLLVLRGVLPSPSAAGAYRFDGERAAVAQVYAAVAGLVDAAGSPRATAQRAALTAALDHAQDALSGPRLRRFAGSREERRLHAQYAAALPLGEAATALAWAGSPLPARASEGLWRLADAVRTAQPCGPLPAPARSDAALRALDEALLHAAVAFDGPVRVRTRSAQVPVTVSATGLDGRPRDAGHQPLHTRPRTPVTALRRVVGPAGREYGIRVALCFGAGAAVAQLLHNAHWYWLPATAVFLVKPDLGPLASRVLCRAFGTVFGAALFAGLAALLPGPAGPVALVVLGGALIPVGTRHFAAQTAVVTVFVLSLVMVGGEPQMALARIGETLLACAIVLFVGHLPLPVPGRGGGAVRMRLTTAGEAAQAYVLHVLSGSDDRAGRWTLRREAYRALAEARTAIDLAAAELPPLARHTAGTEDVAVTLEALVDTTTSCAVHLDDTGRVPEQHAERIDALLAELTA